MVEVEALVTAAAEVWEKVIGQVSETASRSGLELACWSALVRLPEFVPVELGAVPEQAAAEM